MYNVYTISLINAQTYYKIRRMKIILKPNMIVPIFLSSNYGFALRLTRTTETYLSKLNTKLIM